MPACIASKGDALAPPFHPRRTAARANRPNCIGLVLRVDTMSKRQAAREVPPSFRSFPWGARLLLGHLSTTGITRGTQTRKLMVLASLAAGHPVSPGEEAGRTARRRLLASIKVRLNAPTPHHPAH